MRKAKAAAIAAELERKALEQVILDNENAVKYEREQEARRNVERILDEKKKTTVINYVATVTTVAFVSALLAHTWISVYKGDSK